jgi:hypothetical protein
MKEIWKEKRPRNLDNRLDKVRRVGAIGRHDALGTVVTTSMHSNGATTRATGSTQRLGNRYRVSVPLLVRFTGRSR